MHSRGDDVAITSERRVPRGGGEQFRDARLPFRRVLGIAGMQVVIAATRVCIDEQESLVLARERRRTSSSTTCLWTSAKLPAWYWWRYFMKTRRGGSRVYTLSRRSE